ncbi:CE1759 family FMN reductase [Leucobacter aridicollis]|uniref:FMN reductase n=1 Tax=Leucobacter aridicollis TaxID=283878 RepID=A0A852RGG5_9MICO|nr:CE1759 family FMN reductase [Leucobacter aridicollis]MBL3683503.1 NADH-dependent FMN reductase [Leucobacter aridicollis]NYD28446.1 FMN reductase [Leucobacter aridicollis]
MADTKQLVIVNAGTSDPSTTRLLADRATTKTLAEAERRGIAMEARVIDLRPLAGDITAALTTQLVSAELERASEILRDADAIIAATPVYKAAASGLFTSFFQVLDNDLLIGTPVLLAATAGSPRHSLVVDDQLRGFFSYLRTVTAPTSLVSSPEDWNSSEFGKRVDRAATELMALVAGGFRENARGEGWEAYQHSYGSAGGTELGINLDSDLMRLAAGGR